MEPSKVLSLAKRRGFFWPSFEIYGGVAGLYDYGPLGTLLKRNIISVWRKTFVQGEGFAEIEGSNISPEEVFMASGHLSEFTDYLTACENCGEVFRADHLIEFKIQDGIAPDGKYPILSGLLEKLASGRLEAMDLEKEGIKCPVCGGKLSTPYPFNLMFKTTIGAGKRGRTGYLKPETAQGMFTTFNLLYRYHREKLPFGVAQVGKGFRNEISPRQGFIRMREFNMAEIEIFFDPENKTWPGFDEIAGEKLMLVPNTGDDEEIIEMTVGDAVKNGVIANEALAYFVYLTQKFLLDIGIKREKLRFRQHLQDEMAHYASDCWDAELLISYGWTEVVGVADRGTYDLDAHIKASGADLRAFRKFPEPREAEVVRIKPIAAKLGPLFKKDAGRIKKALEEMEVPEGWKDGDSLKVDIDGNSLKVPADCFEVSQERVKLSGEKFVPHVIEPSFGIDRITYALLEQNLKEEEGYTRLTVPPTVAPIKVGVFPLMARDGLDERSREIHRVLVASGINSYHDAGGSIGKRYARMDEIGTPYCITVDYESLEGKGVTIRERDSAEQVRVPEERIAEVLKGLVEGTITLESLMEKN